jgi:repressor LexA
MQHLTRRQTEILGLIRRRIDAEGMPPTRAEIARELGYSSANAAESHLRALAKKGAIHLIKGVSRGIRLVANDAEPEPDDAATGLASIVPTDELPVVGQVAAGAPILAAEHIEAHYPVSSQLFRPRADYLLRVRGMSMRDAGITDGDLIAVHRQDEALNGQIVVARVNDEVTVKRFQQAGDSVQLLPANPEFDPIEIHEGSGEFAIEGRYVGLIRTHADGE